MKKNGNARIIHLVMLALLLVVIWVAYQRISLALKYRARKEEADPAISHLVDEKRTALIVHASQLIEKAELLTYLTSEEKTQITKIKDQTAEKVSEYILNFSIGTHSPILEPIKTAETVLKAQTLERDIVIKLNELATILHRHFKLKGPFEPADNLPAAIKQIEHLLKHRHG